MCVCVWGGGGGGGGIESGLNDEGQMYTYVLEEQEYVCTIWGGGGGG